MSQPTPDSPPIVIGRSGQVATLWINRPAKRNAMTLQMWRSMHAACVDLAADTAVRVLVVRGVGDHFCAGADISGLGEMPIADYQEINSAAESALAAIPYPTVALVSGSCVGGGAGIARACDLRIADTTATFGVTPARLGIQYPVAALERVVRLVGPSAAKHLLFSAELIDGERALRIGLVDELLPPDLAVGRLSELCDLLCERSLLTQQGSKQMIDAIVSTGEVGAEVTEHWRATTAAGGDPGEGIAAFNERRPPTFTWLPDPAKEAQTR